VWHCKLLIIMLPVTRTHRDGKVLIYNVFGEKLNEFWIQPSEDGRVEVQECHVWSAGLVVLTRKHQLFAVNDLSDIPVQSVKLADPVEGLQGHGPTAMTIIEPQFTRSSTVEVLLASVSGSILVVTETACEDQNLRKGPFTKMAVTPNGKMLACFTESGNLWVCSTDFQKNLSEFDPRALKPPLQLVWCGTDSVILYWDKLLLMVGPYGDWVKYSYRSPLVLVPECDGVRIISNEKCEFLHRVPKSTEDIFKIGSDEPSARLHDAMVCFEKKSAKADELIRSIKLQNTLVPAVDGCIDAAAHEFNSRTQQDLLKASAYGKCFCDYYNADNFVENCKTLRVINNLRHPEVGIPITFQQYQKAGADSVVERLVNRHLHFLAYRICEFLKMKPNRVLIHWACCKVRRTLDESEEQVRDMIHRKLSRCPGISFVEVAQAAYDVGRKRLATLVLDYEPSPREQVKLLMHMSEHELALQKAIEAGDTDWVYLVLLQLMKEFGVLDMTASGKRQERHPGAQRFVQMIKDKPVACDLMVSYARSQNPELLVFFYQFTNNNLELARLTVQEACKQDKADAKAKTLTDTKNLLSKPEWAFYAKATEEHIKLLQMQDLDALTRGEHAKKPLSDVISQLIGDGKEKRAQQLKSEFKVPDKRYWWLKLKALAEAEKWSELEKFSKEKRPPIGFGPFVQICLDHDRLADARRYVERIDKPAQKAEFYMKLEDYNAAAREAIAAKDPKLLSLLMTKTRDNQQLQDEIRSHLEALQ